MPLFRCRCLGRQRAARMLWKQGSVGDHAASRKRICRSPRPATRCHQRPCRRGCRGPAWQGLTGVRKQRLAAGWRRVPIRSDGHSCQLHHSVALALPTVNWRRGQMRSQWRSAAPVWKWNACSTSSGSAKSYTCSATKSSHRQAATHGMRACRHVCAVTGARAWAGHLAADAGMCSTLRSHYLCHSTAHPVAVRCKRQVEPEVFVHLTQQPAGCSRTVPRV